jgi:hypothetical protein
MPHPQTHDTAPGADATEMQRRRSHRRRAAVSADPALAGEVHIYCEQLRSLIPASDMSLWRWRPRKMQIHRARRCRKASAFTEVENVVDAIGDRGHEPGTFVAGPERVERCAIQRLLPHSDNPQLDGGADLAKIAAIVDWGGTLSMLADGQQAVGQSLDEPADRHGHNK